MTTYTEGLINDRWPLSMPDFRVEFHWQRPLWESGRLASCFELMEPGMRVYDIGAEHGDFTALYKSWVGTAGDVIPIEPSPHYWPFIRGTLEANGYEDPPAITFEGFIGDTGRKRPLRNKWPQAAFGEGIPDGGFRHLAQDRHTPRTTLDHLVTNYFGADAIVIDIEGAEWHALVGARETLREFKPLVWVSVHEPTMLDWYGKKLDDIHSLMARVGYSGEELPHHGEGETFWLFRP